MEPKKKKLTQARLKELVSYDPETGVFVRRVGVKGHPTGSVVKYKDSNGYLRCGIDGKRYLCHRLAFLYVHGYFPENYIDHINKSRCDNRISNIREASQQCNIRNSRQQLKTYSGVKGVCWHKHGKKWMAQVKVNGKTKALGLYRHKYNAVCARLAAEQCLGWHGCDSNSPAYQYVQNMLKSTKGWQPRH